MEGKMTMQSTVQQVLNDSSASYWLQDAIRSLATRDPVDALNDVEILLKIQRERLAQAVFIGKAPSIWSL
jgi:hypothetical protein